jgi:hypothetical protein
VPGTIGDVPSRTSIELLPGHVWLAQLRSALGPDSERVALAADPNCPPETLAEMISDVIAHGNGGEQKIQKSLAWNPSTSAVDVVRLAEHFMENQLMEVAAARTTDPLLLTRLVQISHSGVRRAVVTNPHTPAAALVLLPFPSAVAKELLDHPNTSPELADRLLASDKNGTVWREALAGLPQHEHLKRIFTKEERTGTLMLQLRALRDRRPSPAIWLSDVAERFVDPELFGLVLANPSCPSELLAAHRTDPLFAWALASNPSLPSTWFADLLLGASPKVTAHAAANPSLPLELIEQLAHHQESRVLLALASNPNTPAAVLDTLAHYSGRKQTKIRLAAINHPNLPPTTARALVGDPSYKVRQAVLRYPAASVMVLGRMSVRELVQQWNFSSAGLPALPLVEVTTLVAMAASWNGTLASLVETARLLSSPATTPTSTEVN